MYLGIEIGGTKLQLAVGHGDGSALVALERTTVEPRFGADGIRTHIAAAGRALAERYPLEGIGIGFGGPLDVRTGRTLKSHHIEGWTDFPLADWCRETLGHTPAIENDADTAGLAEALFGAGQGFDPVLYVTVGTGIGGGLIHGGQIYRGRGRGASELGHLRPGVQCDRPDMIVESFAAGWGIAATAQARLSEPMSHRFRTLAAEGPADAEGMRQRLIDEEEAHERAAGDLLERANGEPERLTTKLVGEAAADGNPLAEEILDRAWQTLGWALAQSITLLAPEAIVIGGGVSLMGERFFEPIRTYVAQYVYPPFADQYRIVPAGLGEEVVLHGALALARKRAASG
jgi:glucokinase